MLNGYINSKYGTQETLTFKDGRSVQVSAVDGDSPYIVSRNNPRSSYVHTRPNGNMTNTQFYMVSAGIVIGGGLVIGLLSGIVTAKVMEVSSKI